MLIVDGHLDLAWNALFWDRDLRCSAYTIRSQEAWLPEKGRALGTVALPEMRAGRIGLCIATLLARSTNAPVAHVDFRSVAQAEASAMGQLGYYRALAREGWVAVLEDAQAVAAHWARWTAWESAGAADDPPPLGVVISMEGADPIRSPDDLPEWHGAGLRLLGPAHYGPCRYAGGSDTDGGLTDLGRALLRAMDSLHMPLDLTHLSDPAFWEVMEGFGGRVFASHNNCRALVPTQRQFDDAQLGAIIERDGVVGLVFDAWMLKPGFIKGHTPPDGVTLENAADHADHICQLAGNARHVCIGSDLDGLFGREQGPEDVDTIADLQKLAGIFDRRGYKRADIAAIMHGNWLRFLGEVLPAGA